MDNYKIVKRVLEIEARETYREYRDIEKIKSLRDLEERIRKIILEEITRRVYPYEILKSYHRIATIRALYLTLLKLWGDYLRFKREIEEKKLREISKKIIENFFYKLNLLFLKQNQNYKRLLDIYSKNVEELVNKSSESILKLALLLL